MSTWVVETTGDVALTATTAKTVLQVINSANGVIKVVEFGISFDSTSSTAEPITVELTSSTQASTGTSTSQTPVQVSGATRTATATGARNYTAEPTVLTVLKRWLVHPQAGLTIQFPLGREPQQNVTQDALGLRITAPASVNCQGYIEFTEDG